VTTIATLVKRYTLWRAQKGATLAQLEQWQASISLPSTIKMIFLLKAFTWTSAGLVFIWSWYFLGSQAVSREYTLRTSARYRDQRLIFPNAESPSAFQSAGETPLDFQTIFGINQQFFQAYVFWNGENNDYWGADGSGVATIPLLEAKDVAVTDGENLGIGNATKGNWHDVKYLRDSAGNVYNSFPSSWLGTNIFYPGPHGGTFNQQTSAKWLGDYSLHTSYVFANCGHFSVGNGTDAPAGSLPGITTSFNVTSTTSTGYPQVEVWTRQSNSSLRAVCNLESHHYETKVRCDTSQCIVHSMRMAPHVPFSTPALNFVDKKSAQAFFDNLLVSTGVPVLSENKKPLPGGTFVIEFMLGLAYSDGSWWTGRDEAHVALELSSYFTMMINTYLKAAQANGDFPEPNANGGSSSVNDLFDGTKHDANWPTTQAHGAIYDPRYYLSLPWIAVDLITCGILFMSAVASFWLRTVTFAPDIFGYVSSLTRDNPHMRLPEGGSTLSGLDRTRALKDVKVKIADLNGDRADVGHIGLTVVHADIEMGQLEKDKHYM
jgi:hypothetical protein